MNGITKARLIKIWSYLARHKIVLAIYVAMTILVSLLELFTPWPMKIIVDSVVGDHPLPYAGSLTSTAWTEDKVSLLIVTIVASLGLKLVLSTLRIGSSYLSVRVRQNVVLELKGDLFNHLQHQSLSFYDARKLGDIVSRVNNDVWGIDESILTIMPLVVSTFSLAGMFFIMFSLNWKMAVVSLFVIPLFYGTYGVYSKRFATRVEEVQRMEGESMSIIQEVLGGLRIVKAFTREKHEHERFVSQGRSAAEARISLTNQQVIHSMVVGLITAGGTSLVLGIGAYQVLNGALTLGELLVILAYLASVYGPIEAVSTAMTYLHGYVAKMRRIFEIMEIEPDIRDAPRAKAFSCTRGNISFQSVRFSYANREHVLSDVSFSVDPGEVIGIVGPTGSGKTTLMSLIPRFYDPSAGRILIDDTDIRQLQVKSLREQVSIVPQEGILFWGTIRENIGYGKPGARLEEIMESARNAGAHEFITRLPDGYETHVGERGLTLSGGEKQRISIARAFLKNAPILILDEPTSALDARTESLLLDAIWRLTKGRTAFIVAHRLSTIRAADRILALERGRIVEQGTHSELLALDGLYASLYRQQTQFTGAHARGDH